MGIEPTLFGPSFWGTMHYVALGAPSSLDSSQQSNYKSFYNLIPFIIPCGSCGTHFTEVLNALPIDNSLGSSASLFEWTVKVHNAVNKRLGKSEISVEDAKKIWMSGSSSLLNLNLNFNKDFNKNDNKTDIVLKVLLFLLISGAVIYIGKTLFTMQHKKK
jgi:hypothetical protein